MDITSLLAKTIFSNDTIDTISKNTKTDSNGVSDVLSEAIPALISCMQNNASTESGAEKLDNALEEHAKSASPSDFLSLLTDIDTDDGSKILKHILGDDSSGFLGKVKKKTGIDADKIGNILANAAPLLLNVLGNQKKKTKTSSGGLIDLLGSLLGSSSSGSGTDAGDIIGDLLGDLITSSIKSSDSKKTTKKTSSTGTKKTSSSSKKTSTKTASASKKKTSDSKKTTSKKK